MKTSAPPTGRKIVLEVVNEMEQRLYLLLYRTLPPSVYHVYLHPDDYREIEAVVPLIVVDAQQGLNAKVEEMNRRGKWWTTLVTQNRPQVELPRGGWEIFIHPDANGEIGLGAIGIVSRLSLPAAPSFESGTPTTRIARTVVTGSIRKTSAAEDVAAPIAPAPPMPTVAAAQVSAAPPVAMAATLSAPASAQTSAPPPVPVTLPEIPRMPVAAAATITSERSVATIQPDMPAQGGVARLAYVDDEGPHVFVMRKEIISIGRGGSAHWVDIQVATTPRVSREHCRIRRDADGRFFVQDISSWGTSVDGQPVPPFLRRNGDKLEETGHERELPRKARIQLADAIVIEFEANGPGR